MPPTEKFDDDSVGASIAEHLGWVVLEIEGMKRDLDTWEWFERQISSGTREEIHRRLRAVVDMWHDEMDPDSGFIDAIIKMREEMEAHAAD